MTALDLEKAAYVLGKRALIVSKNGAVETLHQGKKRKAESNDVDLRQPSGSDELPTSQATKARGSKSSRTRSSKSTAQTVTASTPSGSKRTAG